MNNLPEIKGYEIQRELGHGGMSTVYLARQVSLDREVALKIMAPALAADREFPERFMREARTAAKLQHPGIVAIHDTGVSGHSNYIAMEYVVGGDLKARIADGALQPGTAAEIASHIAAALAYAHDKGFVHRDVKPENILFREEGHVVLTDFGIARAMGSGTRMTATGLSIGTPHYMSPEQARGRDVDGRSDLYALGVVFYEMLTGEVPFNAQDSFAVGLMHISEAPPGLPSDLKYFQPVVGRLLAKQPDDRYQSGSELVADLARVQQSGNIDSPRRATRFVSHAAGQRRQPSVRPAGGTAGWKWAFGGSLLAIVLAAGLFVWQDLSKPELSIGGGSISARPTPALRLSGAVAPEQKTVTPDSKALAPEPRVSAPVSGILASEPEIPAPEPDARASSSALSGRATLHISSVPEGADVFLDGQRMGATPFRFEDLPGGEHRLRLVHHRFEPWQQTVHLEHDEVERIEVTLQRSPGTLAIVTEPPGARVWIDGSRHDEPTPVDLSGLTAGDSFVEIRLPLFRTISRTVEIRSGETTRLDLRLERGDLYEWGGEWLTGQQIIPVLLEAAEADLDATRLMQPDGDNAWEKYQQVLDIRPDHSAARDGINRIAGRYLDLVDSALSEGNLESAEIFLANAETAGAPRGDYNRAKNRLQAIQEEHRAEQLQNQLVRSVQTELLRLGRNVSLTGSLDVSTAEAIRAFERAMEQSESGEASDALLARLQQSDEWPGSQAGEIFRDCPDCPEMVVLPAGDFMMGSSGKDSEENWRRPRHDFATRVLAPGGYSSAPEGNSDDGGNEQDRNSRHRVEIGAFALATTEVTVAEFRRFVEATGYLSEAERNTGAQSGCYSWTGGTVFGDVDGRSWRDPGFHQGDDYPAVCLSWNDARAYLSWLSDQTGQVYRLPSEAEHEYALRAGSKSAFPWGNNADEACIHGNAVDQSAKTRFSDWSALGCDDNQQFTAPVGSYRKNSFGLYDMTGNVVEWTRDCWNVNQKGSPADGSARMSGDCDRAVLRGGSWHIFAGDLRSAARIWHPRSYRGLNVGFRPARAVMQCSLRYNPATDSSTFNCR